MTEPKTPPIEQYKEERVFIEPCPFCSGRGLTSHPDAGEQKECAACDGTGETPVIRLASRPRKVSNEGRSWLRGHPACQEPDGADPCPQFTATLAEIDRLRAENERLTADNHILHGEITNDMNLTISALRARMSDLETANRIITAELNTLRDASALRARVAELEAQLRRYGNHDEHCAVNNAWRNQPCNCGYTIALNHNVLAKA